jgi:holo-[acyl-carrier protein] synthase
VKNKVITGSGIDVVEIGRIQHAMERYGRRFLDRVYLDSEQAYCLRKRNSAESFAARFAAKEAAAKALGTGISQGVSWREIEVVRAPSGRPSLRFHGRAAQIAGRLGVAGSALSLTHTSALAMASVVLEDGK